MTTLAEYYAVLQDINVVSIVFRLLLASCLGGILGVERAKSNQAAGMRTYMLVCIGATVVMLTSQYMAVYFQTGDPARLGAQVISGIGFLGAGSIMTGGKLEVRGLTTAAGLWTAACIGLAIGIGFYIGGILATIAVYLTVSWLKPVAYHFSRDDNSFGLYIEVTGVESLPAVYKLIEQADGYLSGKEITAPRQDGSCGTIVSVKLAREKNPDDLISLLRLEDCVKEVKFINYSI